MLSLEEIENNLNDKKKNYNIYIIFLKTIFFCLLVYILNSKSFHKLIEIIKIKFKLFNKLNNNLIIIVLFGLFYYIIEYYI
mgnify:CR=1 FL=1